MVICVKKRFLELLHTYYDSVKTGERKLSKDSMLILILSGILIYVILLPINNNTSYTKKTNPKTTENAGYTAEVSGTTANKQQMLSNISYQKELEEELEEFLSQLKGVGEVEVLIYVDASEKYVVEKDKSTDYIENSEEKSAGENRKETEQNQSEETVYTVNETGDQVPFISQTKTPGIAGVAVAAQGAENEQVRVQIIRMVMALYGLEANKVEVYVLKNSNEE